LGAEAAFDVETSDFVSEAAALSGDGFDIVVDTSPKAGQPVLDAIKILRPGGTLVCAGHKGAPLDGFPYDSIALKRLRLVGVLGASHEALQMAAGVVSSRTLPISELRTHVFGFDNLPKALDVLQGKVEGENAINVVVTPTFTTA
jgi:threonine dehydrogenase-like Zn-dependent dehydrogenase